MNGYRLHLLVAISKARIAGYTHFADALVELLKKDFPSNSNQ